MTTTYDNSLSGVPLVGSDFDAGNVAASINQETSNSTSLNFTFNLGQLNADASMSFDPSFGEIPTQDIGHAHHLAEIYWYADINKGWHKLFRFKVDSDNLISDSSVNDITYFTDPTAWLVGCDFSGVDPSGVEAEGAPILLNPNNAPDLVFSRDASGQALRPEGVNISDLRKPLEGPDSDGITHPPHNAGERYYDTSFNLLASLGNDGAINPSLQYTGSTKKLQTNESNNFLATSHEDSISKDFLRHMANEVMGGYSAGARRGLVDIFSNEVELLKNLDISVNDAVYASHQIRLKDTAYGYKTGSDMATINATNLWEVEPSSNIVQLHGKTLADSSIWNDTSNNAHRKFYNNATQAIANVVDASLATQINFIDNSSNVAAVILGQILKETTGHAGINGIDRIDNLLTPNDASGVWTNNLGDFYGGNDGTKAWRDKDGGYNVPKVGYNTHVGIPRGADHVIAGGSRFDYRRRRNKHDYMELLQSGDEIVFIVTIDPKGGAGTAPLGANPINGRKYRVCLKLRDAPNVNYTVVNNLGLANDNNYVGPPVV